MSAETFPISLPYHIVFCAVAFAFFLFQFIRLRRPHQLIFAIAIPASLLIYIRPADSDWFYGVGLFEAVLILGAIVLSIIDGFRRRKADPVPPEPQEEQDYK